MCVTEKMFIYTLCKGDSGSIVTIYKTISYCFAYYATIVVGIKFFDSRKRSRNESVGDTQALSYS